MESLHEHIKGYQDQEGVDDAAMVQLLCDLLETSGVAPAVIEAFPVGEA